MTNESSEWIINEVTNIVYEDEDLIWRDGDFKAGIHENEGSSIRSCEKWRHIANDDYNYTSNDVQETLLNFYLDSACFLLYVVEIWEW